MFPIINSNDPIFKNILLAFGVDMEGIRSLDLRFSANGDVQLYINDRDANELVIKGLVSRPFLVNFCNMFGLDPEEYRIVEFSIHTQAGQVPVVSFKHVLDERLGFVDFSELILFNSPLR